MQLANRADLLAALNALSTDGRLNYADSTDQAHQVYSHALGDLMQLFRLARPTANGVEIEGETALLFVRSLAAHLADDIAVTLPLHADQLLAAAELARHKQVAHPTPVRDIFAANALIIAHAKGHPYILMQFDDGAQQFQLIGGKRDPTDRDNEHTVLREIQEELELPDLHVPTDLTLVPVGERFEQTTLSRTYGVVTSYHISFYHVQHWRSPLRLDALAVETRWIAFEHIRAGRLPDGRKVSDLAVQSLGDYLDELTDSADLPTRIDGLPQP
jgi:8-oxo-dGTP pyrophosphatase MutT (NUDIX family)